MTKTLAIVNQKGGVGKTTTAINLGAALAETGLQTLLIDLDPQGNASTGLGIDVADRRATTYDVLLDDLALADGVLRTSMRGLFVIPSTPDLSSADIQIHASERRTFLLRDAIKSASTQAMGLDYILIDCPPSLSLLTLNAMIAADAVLVPLQGEFFALEGLSQLMLTVREVRASANPDLRIEGVILTMYDGRNRLAQQVLADARDILGDLVFSTVIPRNVRVSEAPSFGLSVLSYDPASKGSAAYRELASEMLRRDSTITRKETA